MEMALKPRSADIQGDSLTDVEIGVRPPRRYRVVMHNDDYTSMEFVVEILISIFYKNPQQAIAIMLTVHNKGRCVCGVYTAEVAETKVALVHDRARKAGYLLRCSMEEE